MQDNEIRKTLLEILRIGILRIRVLGWNGHADQCAIEADHLHNLPSVIESLHPDQLRYYYDVERKVFMGSKPSGTNQFELEWDKLAKLIGDA